MANIDETKYDLPANGISIEIVKPVSGQNAIKTLCPKCSANRSTAAHRKEPVLYVNLDNGSCYCHNCGAKWRMDSKEYLERKKKAVSLAKTPTVYNRPKAAKNEPGVFTPDVMKYLTKTRGLNLDVLKNLGITEQTEYMPQTGKNVTCIVFNYIEQGYLVNQKFRDASKNFKLIKGAELIPYNIDSCLGKDDVLVTEGEFDVAALMTAGFDSVISVPSGANGNTDWMNRFYDLYFKDKKKVYIATDMDAPGVTMAKELIRRFGPEICYRVTFSEGCKDANDELLKHGVDGLKKRVEEAKEIPMPELVSLNDFEADLDALYVNGPKPGAITGWKNFDSEVTFGTKQLALVTGRTNDGKSEWLDELVIRISLRTGWNIAYWSAENDVDEHAIKIIEKLTGRQFKHKGTVGVQPEQYDLCKNWIKKHNTWIHLDEDQMKLDNILEKCRSVIRKYNSRILVLDPYNYIEKENNATRSENAWDSHVIGDICKFACKNDVLVFLVAHPRKVEMQLDGRKRRITIEDISGTADFGNKADYCFCVDRDDDNHIVTISIDKVRRKQYGSKGKQAYFVYQANCGRYLPCEKGDDKKSVNADYKTDAGMWIKPGDLFGNIESNMS